ncbi:Uncharacterised protein [Klebsiella pneumoniae]|nr:Uncharacterised protein [Klebsiella pneumoniae]
MGFFYILNKIIHPEIVKAHSIDQTFGINQAEKTRLVISRLWTRRYSADLNRAKPHCTKGIDALPVFIKTGCQTKRIFKRQAHAVNRFRRHFLPHQCFKRRSCNTA